jgi:hypothetical protein
MSKRAKSRCGNRTPDEVTAAPQPFSRTPFGVKTPHDVFTKVQTVVEGHFEGPFDIVYVNSADNPVGAP